MRILISFEVPFDVANEAEGDDALERFSYGLRTGDWSKVHTRELPCRTTIYGDVENDVRTVEEHIRRYTNVL